MTARFEPEKNDDQRSVDDSTPAKTREEIEHLKENWFADPCWDIENTEGFEAHRMELLTYRLACELEWKQKETDRQIVRANTLGCSLTMVHYLEILEHKIDRLDRENDKRKGG